MTSRFKKKELSSFAVVTIMYLDCTSDQQRKKRDFSTYYCWLNFSMLFCCCRVEDTDDLVPIFNRQSDMLKRTYGEYFLAEVVAAQNDHMKCIIAEVCFYVSVSSEM